MFRGPQDLADEKKELLVDLTDKEMETAGVVAAFLELVVHGRLRSNWAELPPIVLCDAASRLVRFLRKWDCGAALRTLPAVFAAELLNCVPTRRDYSLEAFALAAQLDDPAFAAKAVRAHVTLAPAESAPKYFDHTDTGPPVAIDPLLAFDPSTGLYQPSMSYNMPVGSYAQTQASKRTKWRSASVSPQDIPLGMMPFIDTEYFWALSASHDRCEGDLAKWPEHFKVMLTQGRRSIGGK